MSMYIVDRFEGKIAVLEDDGGVMHNVPVEDLPNGVQQGDVLVQENGILRIDREATRKRSASIRKQMDDLLGGSS